MKRGYLLAYALCPVMAATPIPCWASEPFPSCKLASVRIVSHGASGTVIYTRSGKTLILSCGHAFAGEMYRAPLTVDVPLIQDARVTKSASIRLLAVDHNLDLSLIEADVGPAAGCVQIADGPPMRGEEVLSIGFDSMRWPVACKSDRVKGFKGGYILTERAPRHGRSGGALVDRYGSKLYGVVVGYEFDGRTTGLYVSTKAVKEFLSRSIRGRTYTFSGTDVLDSMPSVGNNNN